MPVCGHVQISEAACRWCLCRCWDLFSPIAFFFFIYICPCWLASCPPPSFVQSTCRRRKRERCLLHKFNFCFVLPFFLSFSLCNACLSLKTVHQRYRSSSSSSSRILGTDGCWLAGWLAEEEEEAGRRFSSFFSLSLTFRTCFEMALKVRTKRERRTDTASGNDI